MERKLEDLSPRASAEVIRVLTDDRRRLIEALKEGLLWATEDTPDRVFKHWTALLAEMKERTP